jgi:predicted RNase H-like HicB family nuclease
MNLPYTLVIRMHDDESGKYFSGRWLELDGCSTYADTIEELLQNVEEAKKGWLSVKLEYGDPIPEPLRDEELFQIQRQLWEQRQSKWNRHHCRFSLFIDDA